MSTFEERLDLLEVEVRRLTVQRTARYLGSEFVSSEAPSDDQILQWDDTNKKWRPAAVTTMKAPTVITPSSLFSVGTDLAGHAEAAPASATWPTSNKAIFVPFWIPEAITVTQLFWRNGAAVSGNVDVGIYNSAGTRQISTTSTAQSGTNTIQSVDVADTALSAGVYYLACALDNTTGTITVWTLTASQGQSMGLAVQTSAFALPATATLASYDTTALPWIGLTTRTFV